ncbi:hypothetical protein EDC30_103205 [Paucimonas lemoignei]|uniref:Uncharacterized protein n=2 Tax=Paucimonas lemoignei TaxID=29443 RepID=A0A4R3HZ01_PAULE|nr:hypothetical protein EDC30_103205 [Paucimonas lemoignei]
MNEYSLAKTAAAVFEKTAEHQREVEAVLTALASAITQFKARSEALPAQVHREVERNLSEAARKAAAEIAASWNDANTHAEKATEAYKKAAIWAPWKIAAIAMLSTLFGIAGMVIVARSTFPDAQAIAALRIEEANLRAQIQQLTARGGYATLASCQDSNGRQRLCVQIDESAKTSAKGYRIVKGY